MCVEMMESKIRRKMMEPIERRDEQVEEQSEKAFNRSNRRQ